MYIPDPGIHENQGTVLIPFAPISIQEEIEYFWFCYLYKILKSVISSGKNAPLGETHCNLLGMTMDYEEGEKICRKFTAQSKYIVNSISIDMDF